MSYTIDEISDYPFLPDAKKYLKEQNINVVKMIQNPKNLELFKEAIIRISDAGDGQVYHRRMANVVIVNDKVLPTDLITYVISVIILKASSLHSIVQKFALAEARRAEKFLEKSLKHISTQDTALDIMRDLFGFAITRVEGNYLIPIANYIPHAVEFHEKEWKLINRRVEDGYVFLTAHEVIRLVRKEISAYIQKFVKSIPVSEQDVELLKKYVDIISIQYQDYRHSVIPVGQYPPCIVHVIDVLKRGENLPHSGRFMLATYLLKIGKTIEDIVPIFHTAPDFNDKITRYQLDNISKSQYMCPSCEKIDSLGSCFRNNDCDGIINPLQFRK